MRCMHEWNISIIEHVQKAISTARLNTTVLALCGKEVSRRQHHESQCATKKAGYAIQERQSILVPK